MEADMDRTFIARELVKLASHIVADEVMKHHHMVSARKVFVTIGLKPKDMTIAGVNVTATMVEKEMDGLQNRLNNKFRFLTFKGIDTQITGLGGNQVAVVTSVMIGAEDAEAVNEYLESIGY
jgi:hypothetical protein